jgi:hypothetical protein
MKCDICGKKVQELFLGKVMGSFVYNKSGKKKLVCNDCQKTMTLEEIKEKL